MKLPSAVESLITEGVHAVDAGATFPDYLYVCGSCHDCGEYAHWHRFHQHFAAHITKKYPNWAHGDEHGAKLVAFLMGVTSHYMADVNWHGLGAAQTGFINQLGLMDKGCKGDMCDTAHAAADAGGEFTVAMQIQSSNIDPLKWWIPTADIVDAFAGANFTVKPSWINECAALLASEIEGVKVASPIAWNVYARDTPFLEQNLEDFFIGGMDDNAAWSALVWSEVVDWLSGRGTAPTLHRAAELVASAKASGRARLPVARAAVTVKEAAHGAVEVDLSTSPKQAPAGNSSLSYQGFALALCDLDGDGTEDEVLGEPGVRGRGEPLVGGARVRFGNGKEVVLRGEAVLARLGSTLACADIDGDGRVELFAAAPTQGPWEVAPRPGQDWYFENQTHHGAVHAFRWNGKALVRLWTWQSDVPLGVCGYALAVVQSHLVVGCPYSSPGSPAVGRVLALDATGAMAWQVYGSSLGERLGSSIAGLPELGLVAVGAPGFRGAGLTATGLVLLLEVASGREALRHESSEAKAQFGRALAASGAHLWVASPGANHTIVGPNSGRVDQMLVTVDSKGQPVLAQQRSLEAWLPTPFAAFGLALAALPSGSGVAVGAPLAREEHGDVHVFSADGSKLKSFSGEVSHSRFGLALAVSNTSLLVGAPKESGIVDGVTIGGDRHGKVYRYDVPTAAAELPLKKRAHLEHYDGASVFL